MKITKIVQSSLLSILIVLPIAVQALPESVKQHYKPTNTTNVVINAPEIAENGAYVSIKIEDIKNLPTGSHVEEILIFNDFRKEPVAHFKLGENASPINLSTRVKMRKTGNIYALAKLSNGEVFSGETKVKVTKGGCGGNGE